MERYSASVAQSNKGLLKTIEYNPVRKRGLAYETRIKITDDTIVDCSIVGDKLLMKVEVEYVPRRKLLEFESFRKYLESLRNGILEEYCLTILNDLTEVLDPIEISVTVEGVTHGHGTAVVKMRAVGRR